MQRRNDIFFFTFIDLLLQVLFVVFLLLAANTRKVHDGPVRQHELDVCRAQVAECAKTRKELAGLLKLHGVSNIVELSDKLSHMVPADRCVPPEQLQREHEFVASHGGIKEIDAKLALLEDAYGAPPCERQLDRLGNPILDERGRSVPIAIATIRVSDDTIEFEEATPSEAFGRLLSSLRLSYPQIRKLSIAEFRNRFDRSRVVGAGHCRHFVWIRPDTQLRVPVDTVRSIFRQKGLRSGG